MNRPFPPFISNPASLSGVCRLNVMDSSLVVIDVILSSGTFRASTAAETSPRTLIEVFTNDLPCTKYQRTKAT